MTKKIFISHSSIDTWVALQIKAKLIELGTEVFLDEGSIDIGDDFERVIISEIGKSHEFIILLTPWAVKRPYIWLEIGAAMANQIRIIGILYGINEEELTSTADFPVVIKKTNFVRINEIDKYFEQLKRRTNNEDGKHEA